VEEVNQSSKIRTRQKLSLMFICHIITFTGYCISTFTSYCLRSLNSCNMLNLRCNLIANQMPSLNILNSISNKFYSWTINLLLPPATRNDIGVVWATEEDDFSPIDFWSSLLGELYTTSNWKITLRGLSFLVKMNFVKSGWPCGWVHNNRNHLRP
jgi:hypothetical protein